MSDTIAAILIFLLNHEGVLHALAAGISISSGVAISMLWFRTLREQSWLLLFACVYLIFFSEYIARGLSDLPWAGGEDIARFMPIVFSALNNILLLLSAALLMKTEKRRLHMGFRTVTVLGLATGGIVGSASYYGTVNDSPAFARYPDMLFSVAVLLAIGWALMEAVPLSRYRVILRYQAGLTSVCYIAFQVLHGFAPNLASMSSKVASAFASRRPSENFEREFIESLDLVAFAASIPLKLSFFLLVFYIVSRALEQLHPRVQDEALAWWRPSSQDLKVAPAEDLAVGYARKFGADVCEICLRLPGQRRPTVLWRTFSNGETQRDKITDLPKDKSNVGWVLETGRNSWGSVSEMKLKSRYLARHPDQQSILTTPIFHAGTVIGAFSLEWKDKVHLSETLALQVEQIAGQLALFLEKERELAAISQLSQRLARLEVADDESGVRNFAGRCLEAALDLLAPDYLVLRFEMGFKSFVLMTPEIQTDETAKDGTEIDRLLSIREDLQPLESELSISPSSDDVTQARNWLRSLGHLVLFVPRKNQPLAEITRPILGTSAFHRELIASVLADAILDGCRRYLDAKFARVLQALSAPNIESPEQWLEALNRSLREAGLSWVAAEAPEGARLLGSLEVVEWHSNVRSMVPDIWEGLRVYPCETLAGARSVVRLPLPGFESGWLWIGVPRNKFGAELEEPPSPWRGFLERVAENAGSALAQIQARFEIEGLWRQAAIGQALVTQSTIIHEIKNHTIGFVSGLGTLLGGIEDGSIQAGPSYRELLEAQYEEASRLLALTRPLSRVRAYDDRRPAAVKEAVESVKGLYRGRIQSQRFRLTEGLPEDLPEANIPFYVLTMALANLVSNALDAQDTFGQIRITAKFQDERLVLKVTDDGPGIRPELNVFSAGTTTKKGGSGIGMFLTRKSLENEGGEIELISRDRGKTTFELNLPIAHRQEGDPNGTSA